MNVPDLEMQYKEIGPLAERFAQELSRQMEELLLEQKITLGFPLQHRIKAWNSIAGKLERKLIEVKEIREVTDLIGFRATLLFQRDALAFCELIKKNFD